MSDPTQTQNGRGLMPPNIPSGQEIYDSIMAVIEPELTSSQLPLLKEKYAGETLEQKKERGKRYKKAFAAYEIAFRDYAAALHQETTQFQRNARRFVEEMVSAYESDRLSGIESMLSAETL